MKNTYKDSNLRVGIAGLGMAGSSLLPAIQKHPHISVTAACDPDLLVRTKFAQDYGVDVFSTVEQLSDSSKVDVIYIATPSRFHTEHVITAAESKKHIIVEKPIAITIEDAIRAVEVAERNGVKLIVGHSHSFEPAIMTMREIVESGKIGSLRMIHNWYYNDWMYRPRIPEELNTQQGGGVTFRQGSHQFDIIRLIGGGKLRSVRAMTGVWDPARPTEGAHVAFLEFEEGVAATAVYNGYDHFHSTELTFNIGEGGPLRTLPEYGSSRLRIQNISNPQLEIALKRETRYGGANVIKGSDADIQPAFFGLTLVSCEKGDIRQSPDGLWVYGENRKYEISLPKRTGRDNLINELYSAVVEDSVPLHDGKWGLANLEVCMAVLESAKTRSEILLQHQVSIGHRD
ncbi:Gfo/Idh/MocA family oxidoreductase [Aneurinibacillus sp. Ricciae_BoGa-3]|uniref:Gfo/Idh/MocA family oxidoreductase n=1 Tax=Aneurinibacillus sp. Ricciae_BoGa-3 TaxID=3022697 RepID=UPI00233FDB52|nr:Gfo/Idh/MocA family oxidoreductase [Aneurinibacillus sp. Ricciae_BoGa-3]WCK52329.1 Gfo/Idh/MocA family oxidoreductase [Aneurinibacillus sp. Ricciae_BoGa-3]